MQCHAEFSISYKNDVLVTVTLRKIYAVCQAVSVYGCTHTYRAVPHAEAHEEEDLKLSETGNLSPSGWLEKQLMAAQISKKCAPADVQ